MQHLPSKGRGFVPKRITPPRVAARLKNVVKNRGTKNIRKQKKG